MSDKTGEYARGLDSAVGWDDENRQKPLTMGTKSPRPSNEGGALVFGTTANAIQTALSRFDITCGVEGRKAGKLRDLSGLKQRKCLTCQKPSLGEGKHNWRRTSCK